LGGKPLILRTVEKLQKLPIDPIIVVVGFARKSVMNVLKNKVDYAIQRKILGTANALKCGIKKLPKNINTILVLGGDDSAFYSEEILENLIKSHFKENAAITFLALNVDNPFGLGRVIRDNYGEIIQIIEDKDATDEQKKITEVNPGLYVIQTSFLKKYLNKVKKSLISGEYYLTSLVDLAIKSKEKVLAANAGKILWRGVNTPQDLIEAQKIFSNLK
jgi:bifunctional UDP-N-acetylglucosamine pyrophosphorylase / glucosamine-1-phosphate N-acetyltransferase